jgi:hypothetical protein
MGVIPEAIALSQAALIVEGVSIDKEIGNNTTNDIEVNTAYLHE